MDVPHIVLSRLIQPTQKTARLISSRYGKDIVKNNEGYYKRQKICFTVQFS